MRITGMAIVAVLAGAIAQADETQLTAERTVTVCVERNGAMGSMPFARVTASKMFAEIGVTIQWWLKPDSCPAQGILIRLSGSTPHDFRPGALAYAQLFDGAPRIQIFYDRIAERHDQIPAPLLQAHVLVHEITHILQAIARHSENGVMKAKWDYVDYTEMARKPLLFTEYDVALIQRGLAKRAGAAQVASN